MLRNQLLVTDCSPVLISSGVMTLTILSSNLLMVMNLATFLQLQDGSMVQVTPYLSITYLYFSACGSVSYKTNCTPASDPILTFSQHTEFLLSAACPDLLSAASASVIPTYHTFNCGPVSNTNRQSIYSSLSLGGIRVQVKYKVLKKEEVLRGKVYHHFLLGSGCLHTWVLILSTKYTEIQII